MTVIRESKTHGCHISTGGSAVMGLFSKVFGGSSDIENKLRDRYVPLLQERMRMLPSDAKNAFSYVLKLAKEESHKLGTLNLPQNLGDILLEAESIDERIRSYLAKLRSEGVRDRDIRWWFNRQDIERRLILKIHDWLALARAVFKTVKAEDDLSDEEAAKKVRKLHPIYGDPEDTRHTIGEDTPLPYPLMDRISIYIERRKQEDPIEFKKDLKESSTFNAFVRKEMRNGRL